MDFATEALAKSAILKAQGYHLDKQHTFKVNLFSDFELFGQVPEEYQEKPIKPFIERVCTAFACDAYYFTGRLRCLVARPYVH